MLEKMEKSGANIRKTYYCIHQDSDNCDCRKPKTGMFKQTEKELKIKIKGSFFIGDGKMDVEAGHRVGLRTVLVLSGKTTLKGMRSWNIKPDYVFDDLYEAVDFILNADKRRSNADGRRLSA